MSLRIFLAFIAIVTLTLQQEEGEGERRLRRLKQKSEKEGGIMNFNAQDFSEFALHYPRPYHLVVYFTGTSCKLCEQLKTQYEYMATLYEQQGATKSAKNPVFFAIMTFNRQNQLIFDIFGFKSIPNIIVSRPEMPIISEIQKKQYMQKFKWAISYSDGDVTTHKMLDFVNQRTDKNVFYKPTLSTMLAMFFGFISVMGLGVIVYTQLRSLWTHWLVWFSGVILIYVTCVSGVVYNIIHNVPFVGQDRKTGETLIFSGGNREQYGAEGLLISLAISIIGCLFISIVIVTQRVKSRFVTRIWGLAAILVIFWITWQVEGSYRQKSWYGPSFYPPSDYSKGSIAWDQGNNI